MDDLVERLGQHVTYAYMPAECRRTMDEAAARIDALEAQLAAREHTLRQIACYGDHGAERYLAATGCYTKFDEPNSVEAARAELEATPYRSNLQ